MTRTPVDGSVSPRASASRRWTAGLVALGGISGIALAMGLSALSPGPAVSVPEPTVVPTFRRASHSSAPAPVAQRPQTLRDLANAELPPGMPAEGLGSLGTRRVNFGPPMSLGTYGPALASDGEVYLNGDDLEVNGRLDRSIVERVIERYMNQLRYCYQRRLAVDANLEGEVLARFRIGRDGTVMDAHIADSTLEDEQVDRCVASRFMRMRFPHLHGSEPVDVVVPMAFSAG